MSEQRKSIFDRSFDEKSDHGYICFLKSGVRIIYVRRSEIWKDKTNSLFITLYDATIDTDGKNAFLMHATEVDVRYNDLSLIC